MAIMIHSQVTRIIYDVAHLANALFEWHAASGAKRMYAAAAIVGTTRACARDIKLQLDLLRTHNARSVPK